MSESLGTGVLNLTVDARGVEVGVNRAKSAVSGFSSAALKEYNNLNAAQKKVVDSLNKQASTLDLTRAEVLAYNAALKTSGALQQELLAKIQANTAAAKAQGTQFNEFGRSAKQVTAAMRQVPAQMTDIFVSLQGGQNPLTVLLQQGGQLKDVFGGIKPAASALGGALLELATNPVTILVAALGALVLAVNNVESRQFELAKAIALSGNAAQTSSEQLQGYISQIDETTAASERQASKIVSAVAATGVFTADQILTVSKAAEQMEEATGRSIEKTVAEFASLKEGPVDAILKLNATIGDGTNVTHFLTEETLKQIQALRDQGDEAGATELAIHAYADAIATRTPEVTNNLTSMAGLWRGLKSAAGDAVDGIISGLDAVVKATHDMITSPEMQQSLALMFRLGQPGGAAGAAPKAVVPATQRGPIVDPQQQEEAKKFREQGLRFLTDEAKLEHDLAEARRLATAAGIKDVGVLNERLAAIRKEYAERAGRKNKSGAGGARALANAEVKQDLQSYKDALAVQQASIQQGTQLLQANYAARNVAAADYFAQQRDYLQQGTAAEEQALEGQIAVLQARNVKGKDAVDTVRQIAEMEAQLAKVRAEGSTKLALLTIQEQEFYERRANAIEDYRDRLMESNVALQIQTNAAIARIGMGSREADQQERINQIYVEQALSLQELHKQLARKDIDQVQFDADVKALQEATNQEVAIVTDGFQRMLAAQADWHNGFQQGLQDWLAGTANVAQQISQITNRSLDSASDALADFALTGKLEIKKLLASILTDLVKFFAQRAVMMFVQSFLGSFAAAPTTGSNFGIPLPGSGSNNFFHANGTAFPGSTTLPVNSVLTKPTVFRYAKGAAFGVGGEADPEAVMPLQRGPDGKLGVKLYGGGTGEAVQIHVETNVYSNGTSDSNVTTNQKGEAYKELTAHIQRVTKQAVMDEMRAGGALHRAGVRQQ